jgi:polygalacturonase
MPVSFISVLSLRRILALTTLFFVLSLNGYSNDYDILNYGAEDGKKSTKAIQAAIDRCHSEGGGRVIVPRGRFITGTLVLKDFVLLHLEQGAVLEGSLDREDYLRTFRLHGMIFAEDATNIGITGSGTIQANGIHFYDTTANHTYEEFDRKLTRQGLDYMPEGEFYSDGPYKRLPKPGMTLSFFHCTQLTLKDFTLLDSPSWAIRLAYVEEAMVDNLRIFNNLMIPNSDGIHLTASRNVRINNCHIRGGDDSIVMTGFAIEEDVPDFDPEVQKMPTYGNKSEYAENLLVTNCQLQSRSAGIRVGYGQHPIRRCTFSNIHIYGSNRGIGVFAHDKSTIEEIFFSNITIETRLHNGQWWGNAEPIHLSAVSRFPDLSAGIIKDVYFHQITMVGEHGIILYGLEDSPLENIHMTKMKILIKKGKETATYGGNFDLRPVADPQLRLFKHDIPGLYAQKVNGLHLDHFQLEWGEDLPSFFTHGIWLKDVSGFEKLNVNSPPNPGSKDGKPIHRNHSE